MEEETPKKNNLFIDTSSNPSSGMPTPSKSKDKHSHFYFCQQCKQIPTIKLNYNNKVDIQCNCSKSQKDLNEFIEDIEKINIVPHCDGEDRDPCNNYCTECRIWFCENCLELHGQYMKGHTLIKSDGVIANSLCESENCSAMNAKIEYFCEDCFKHICVTCKEQHEGKKHNVVLIKDMLKDFNMDDLSAYIKEITQKFKAENEYYNEIISDLDSLVKKYKEILKERAIQNRNFIRFYKSLINSYSALEMVSNYPIRKNLLENKIAPNFNTRTNFFKLKFKSDFTQSKLMKFLNETKMDYNISAEYFIKQKEFDKNALRIFGYNQWNSEEFSELNEKNCIMNIDGEIVPFSRKFDPKIKDGRHRVDIIALDNLKIKSMKDMFRNCSSLDVINLTCFDSSEVVDMSNMFNGCRHLTEVKLNGLDTSNVSNMNHMFCSCALLPRIDVSAFDSSKVSSINSMFYGCSSLYELKMFKIVKARDSDYIFAGCDSLEEGYKEIFKKGKKRKNNN